MRCRAAAIGNFADEHTVQDQPELDRTAGVPDGVGDKFADDQLSRERELLEPPGRELPARPCAGVRDDRRLGGQLPGDDPVGIKGVGAGDEQGDVVRGLVRNQGLEYGVAYCLERRRVPEELMADRWTSVSTLSISFSPASMSRSRDSIRPSV